MWLIKSEVVFKFSLPLNEWNVLVFNVLLKLQWYKNCRTELRELNYVFNMQLQTSY